MEWKYLILEQGTLLIERLASVEEITMDFSNKLGYTIINQTLLHILVLGVYRLGWTLNKVLKKFFLYDLI